MHVEALLERLVDGDLDEAERALAMAHIGDCPSCQEAYFAAAAIPRLLSPEADPAAPLGLATAVLRRVREDVRPRRLVKAPLLMAAAIAAGLALGGGAVALARVGQAPLQGSPTVVARDVISTARQDVTGQGTAPASTPTPIRRVPTPTPAPLPVAVAVAAPESRTAPALAAAPPQPVGATQATAQVPVAPPSVAPQPVSASPPPPADTVHTVQPAAIEAQTVEASQREDSREEEAEHDDHHGGRD